MNGGLVVVTELVIGNIHVNNNFKERRKGICVYCSKSKFLEKYTSKNNPRNETNHIVDVKICYLPTL